MFWNSWTPMFTKKFVDTSLKMCPNKSNKAPISNNRVVITRAYYSPYIRRHKREGSQRLSKEVWRHCHWQMMTLSQQKRAIKRLFGWVNNCFAWLWDKPQICVWTIALGFFFLSAASINKTTNETKRIFSFVKSISKNLQKWRTYLVSFHFLLCCAHISNILLICNGITLGQIKSDQTLTEW